MITRALSITLIAVVLMANSSSAQPRARDNTYKGAFEKFGTMPHVTGSSTQASTENAIAVQEAMQSNPSAQTEQPSPQPSAEQTLMTPPPVAVQSDTVIIPLPKARITVGGNPGKGVVGRAVIGITTTFLDPDGTQEVRLKYHDKDQRISYIVLYVPKFDDPTNPGPFLLPIEPAKRIAVDHAVTVLRKLNDDGSISLLFVNKIGEVELELKLPKPPKPSSSQS